MSHPSKRNYTAASTASAFSEAAERQRVVSCHGRPVTFSDESTAAVRVLREASYYACAERLQPFIGELAHLLVGPEQQELESGVHELLDQASVSSVERQPVARRI